MLIVRNSDAAGSAPSGRELTRRRVLACGVLGVLPVRAADRTVLTVATWPGLDIGAKAAIPIWRQRHPDVDVVILSREYGDHHTFVTTSLSTSEIGRASCRERVYSSV